MYRVRLIPDDSLEPGGYRMPPGVRAFDGEHSVQGIEELDVSEVRVHPDSIDRLRTFLEGRDEVELLTTPSPTMDLRE